LISPLDLPFVDLAARNTPLQRVDALAESLGLAAGQLWIKRDDLTGVAAGGNKARKLEYLVADALARGADTLVTTGAAQSNHVRATAAAARQVNLKCVGVLSTLGKQHHTEGNLVLDDLLGLEAVWCGPTERASTMSRVCEELADAGRIPYQIPLGGTNPLGAIGYIGCAQEIEAALPGALVACAVGTGGTQAGLVVGLGAHERVLGFDVAALPALSQLLPDVIEQTAELAHLPTPTGQWQVDRSQATEPYGKPTPAAHDAIRLVANKTGLILDPVYTGRAMAGLINRCRTGAMPTAPLVFIHTGGMPALFTRRYEDWFSLPVHPS
jgi:D-cysteine desulfhydrase family pyridoxal phosphate-dependent enzyme